MKALTLYQPWATLVAIGAKKIETRSWETAYRGPLAIHVSKKFQPEYRSLIWKEPFLSALNNHFWTSINGSDYYPVKFLADNIHLGCVIATCELTNCIKITDTPRPYQVDDRINLAYTQQLVLVPPPEPELSFGDYTPGRFAWILQNVKVLPKPIPAKGALGLWNWEMPA